MRAYSPSEIENLNIPELPLDGEWETAFGRPSRFERWFVSGDSASVRSSCCWPGSSASTDGSIT